MTLILVADTETTGLDPAVDRVVEYAHARLSFKDHWFVRNSISQVCDPERDIPPQASAVHHLTARDVLNKPTVAEFLGMLAPMDRVTHLAFHNAQFDLGFIGHLLPKVPVIDTWRVAEHMMPDAPGHSNQVLRYWLGVQPTFISTEFSHPHRAAYDVAVTAAILVRMLEGLHDAMGDNDKALAELVRLSDPNLPVLRREVRVGKYRGTPWADIDAGYCKWVLGKRGDEAFDLDTRHTASYQLAWLSSSADFRAAHKWGDKVA